ncbi:MAG TPA: hypothetical protein VGO11_13065 [Chthoniobacteraceae bacterium]|jgi:hypothetical protein|nr:hypothetical protein [Chthoniobacteraceae bacterium]
MIFVVSGEGPSDMGACTNQIGQCSGADFRHGPMAVIVDKVVEGEINYSLLDSTAMEFISEMRLTGLSRELPMALSAGKKRDYETAYHFKAARALAKLAEGRRAAEKCEVGAVLFRDADGTRSNERGLYEAKWKSIEDGFAAEAFPHGVPMVPKPKSEAWLLCALEVNPYQQCADLEESLSGNDNSPNPAKAQLDARLIPMGKKVTDLSETVSDGMIDPGKIDMPSFNRFRDRLLEVTRAMRAA